jgi:DNA-binding transcriptional ArsR family regulator
MLDELFGSKLRAKLVAWFMLHSDERYFVRQITSLLKEDATNVSRELARLARLGILESSREGRQKYYRANRSSPFYAELRGLAVKTFGIRDVVRARLQKLSNRIEAAFIFGSFAESRETARSDVDIMIIGDVSFGEVCDSLRPAHEIIGREINPSVYPPREFAAKLKAKQHFLASVLKAEKIFLIGDDHELDRLAKKRLAR